MKILASVIESHGGARKELNATPPTIKQPPYFVNLGQFKYTIACRLATIGMGVPKIIALHLGSHSSVLELHTHLDLCGTDRTLRSTGKR